MANIRIDALIADLPEITKTELLLLFFDAVHAQTDDQADEVKSGARGMIEELPEEIREEILLIVDSIIERGE